jgi:hypothetical protein
MSRIYDLAVSNKKIFANPLLIKMIVNHIRGAEETQNSGLNQQIVIQNWFPTDNAGKPTPPEQKMTIADFDNE